VTTSENKDLTRIIYQYKDSEFSWGIFDCCIFTALIVEEYKDIKLPLWRDMLNYTSPKEAIKTLKNWGCNSLLDLPELILKKSKKDISEVKLGEPVYYEDRMGAIGICNGVRAYFPGEGGGLTARNINECKYAWSID
jgi:hypothetical protein